MEVITVSQSWSDHYHIHKDPWTILSVYEIPMEIVGEVPNKFIENLDPDNRKNGRRNSTKKKNMILWVTNISLKKLRQDHN